MANADTLELDLAVDISQLTSGMAQAEAAVKQASKNMSEAQEAFGKAASEGSLQAVAALKQYESELTQAQAAVARLSEVEAQEGTVLRSTTSARMAAAAELRVLEGNVQGSTRAAAAFLSQLPLVGAAMQAAFPVVGAVAVLEILGKSVEAAHKLYDEFVNLRSIVEITDKLFLEEETRGLEATRERLTLTRQQQVLAAELVGPKAGRQNRGREAGDEFDKAQAIERVATAQERYAQATKELGDYQARAKATESNGSAFTPAQVPTDDAKVAQDFIKVAGEKQLNAIREVKNAQLDLSNTINAAHVQQIEGAEKVGAAEESAAKKAEKAFGDRVSSIIKSDAEARDAGIRVTEALNDSWTKAVNQDRELDKHQEEYRREATREFVEDQRQKVEAAREANQSQARLAADKYRGTEQSTAGQVANQTMDPGQRVAALQAAAAQEYATEVDLNNKLQALDAGDVAKHQADLDKRAQLDQQYYQKQEQLAQQAGQITAQPYINAFTSVNDAWLQMQNKLIFGTKNIGKAFANMGVGLLEDAAQVAEKWAAKWVEKEIMTLVMHQVTNTQKVASDTAAAAATNATTSASNVALALSYAAVAAAGAAAAVAMVPLIGPALAPAAAAATFADTSAYAAVAAFETGGIIPNTGIAMVHQGEAVLPRSLTNMLMSVANDNRSSSSASVNVSMNGSSDRRFREQLTRHADHVVNTVQRGLRRRGIS